MQFLFHVLANADVFCDGSRIYIQESCYAKHLLQLSVAVSDVDIYDVAITVMLILSAMFVKMTFFQLVQS